MIEKLDFLVRFWALKARHASQGEPLAQDEQRELLSLMQLVTGDMQVPEAGQASRTSASLPAQIIGEGTLVGADIRAVMAAALVLTSTAALHVGAQVIVRCADAVSGVEYALPCRVAWVYPGSPRTMALVVDGIPTRSDFDVAHPTAWSVPVAAYERLVRWPHSQGDGDARRQ